jgi:aspartate/methionine/tyrosine aminotransferase
MLRNLLVRASKLGQYSNLSQRLVGQEMFHVLDRARKLEQEGKEVFHLELGDPFSPPDPAILEAVSQALKNNGWHYASPGGETVLKVQIKEFLRSHVSAEVLLDSITVAPANYLITNFLSITCGPGDTLLVVTPCFPSYLASAKMLGLEVFEHPTLAANGYDLDEGFIEKIQRLKPKAIIINSANNPTGAVYSKSILIKIINAAKSINAWILSDETYGLLTYDNDFKTLLNEDYAQLVVLSSFSKIFSVPGLRLGFQVSKSKTFTELSSKYLSTTISCIPPFIQQGCANFLENKDLIKDVLQSVRNQYALETQKLFKEISILSQWMKPPKSAFYLFVPLPEGVDGKKFALNLINEFHVAVTPGISFGSDFNSFVRVATCGEDKKVIQGIRLLANAIQKVQN